MSYKPTHKYTAEYNGKLKVDLLDVLSEAMTSLNISEIQAARPSLAMATPQKLARVLNELVEMNLVRKAQSRSTKRMKYMATSVMCALGYSTVID